MKKLLLPLILLLLAAPVHAFDPYKASVMVYPSEDGKSLVISLEDFEWMQSMIHEMQSHILILTEVNKGCEE